VPVIRNNLKFLAKKLVRRCPESEKQESEFAYQSLNAIYQRLICKDDGELRPTYTWGVLQTCHLASVLGVKHISVIELGVGGGRGLVALERVSEKLENIFKVEIDVYGFDSGCGLPKPKDYRDMPNLWSEGAYPMEEETLRKRLRRAQLKIGLLEETAPKFIESDPAPVGFMSFDLDFYSSTVQALSILETNQDLLLPRIHCYFDDMLGFTYGHHNGERLAIREFNEKHKMRQISKIYGLRYYLPDSERNASWPEKMYMAHILDHSLYDEPDGLVTDGHRNLTKVKV
jgi:hypothetical protein